MDFVAVFTYLLDIVVNICNYCVQIITTKIDLSIIGLGNVSLGVVLTGGGIVALLIYKIVRWLVI